MVIPITDQMTTRMTDHKVAHMIVSKLALNFCKGNSSKGAVEMNKVIRMIGD